MRPPTRFSRLLPGYYRRAPELRILALGVVLAVAALSSVGFFTDRVQRAMSEQATELLGADLVIASSAAPRESVRQSAREAGLQVAETVSFPSVALYRDNTLLTEVKAVSADYPLRGRLRLAAQPLGEEFTARGIPVPGEAWVEPRVLQQLGAGIGDVIRLGERGFTASRVLSYEPDRGGDLFQLAPRVLLNASDLPSTGLITPASRVRYRLLLAGPEAALTAYRKQLERRLAPGEHLQDVRDARPELRAAQIAVAEVRQKRLGMNQYAANLRQLISILDQHGLGQMLAFALGRGGGQDRSPYELLYQQIGRWLTETTELSGDDILTALTENNSRIYREATEQTWRLLSALNRCFESMS